VRTIEKEGLSLERIIFIGRTYEEYIDMFSLSLEELKGKRILDCPAGACSFTAKGTKQHLDITASDIAYYYGNDELYEKGLEDIKHTASALEKVKEHFVWNYFNDVTSLLKHRKAALNDYYQDRASNPKKYIPCTLPTLPFAEEEFDIVLSAHFLFTYADRLDKEFHFAAIDELLRVTNEELRIFPTADLDGNRYAHMDELIDRLTAKGYKAQEMKVGYEFQKNANTMLRIIKGHHE